METKKVGFIGGGRITRIFLKALKNKSVEFESIVVYEPDEKVSGFLKDQFPDIELADNPGLPAKQDLVILAVHPPVMMETLSTINPMVHKDTYVLSLAPKITIEKMASLLPTRKIIRMIPNATSIMNKGYNPVTFNGIFSSEEKNQLMEIFGVLGETFEVEECKLEGYAIVSAMLPTYFWFQWKKMEDIAVKTGLDPTEAKNTIRKTMERSLDLFYDSSLTKDEVMDLIPVKPLKEKEEEIVAIYDTKLIALFEKIRPNL